MYRGSPQCLRYVNTDVDSISLYECMDYNRSARELSVDAALAILLSVWLRGKMLHLVWVLLSTVKYVLGTAEEEDPSLCGVFEIDEKKKEVVLEKTGGTAESYDDFTASLPENDCRYAIYAFDFVTSENCQKSKIFFIAWSPYVSCIRAKILYVTSSDRFRREWTTSIMKSRQLTQLRWNLKCLKKPRS